MWGFISCGNRWDNNSLIRLALRAIHLLPQAGEVIVSPLPLAGGDAERSEAGEGSLTVVEGRMEGKFPSGLQASMQLM